MNVDCTKIDNECNEGNCSDGSALQQIHTTYIGNSHQVGLHAEVEVLLVWYVFTKIASEPEGCGKDIENPWLTKIGRNLSHVVFIVRMR